MNVNYNSSVFHVKTPSVAVEPASGPPHDSSMQAHVFMPGREQYGFQPHGRGGMLSTGPQLHAPSPFNGQQLTSEQPVHPYQDGVASCLHGDRHPGFSGGDAGPQHMFEAEFGQLSEAQARDCLPLHQQQRLASGASGASYQLHGHPIGNHAVPAPCLPLDQSPNRAASFHGLPSSSPESNSLEHCRLFPHGGTGGSQYCFPCDPLSGHFDMGGFSNLDSTEPKFPYCEAGSQMAAGSFPNFSHGGSRAPMIGSKVNPQLPQQNAYSERFGNRGKLEPGLVARHQLVAQQRPGPMGRQNPGSPVVPRLYHTTDFVPNSPDMQNSSIVTHGQLDPTMHKLSGHNMRPFGEPVFSGPQLGPQPPHQRQLSPFPYLNVAKRQRFDIPSGPAGESYSPVGGGLRNRPGLENHLSPSAFPAPMGDFTPHVTDSFPSGPPPLSCGPPQQQPLPRCPNAALMIKQMASRSQQHRMRQADLQPVNHQSDGTLNGMVHRGPLSQLNFEKRHNFHGNFEIQSPHLPHENSWFPDTHQQCREASIHTTEQSQNGHGGIFRSGVTTVDMQFLNSPGLHSQFENSINNHLQVQPSEDGTMQPNTPMDRRPREFGEAALRRQRGFLPGGSNQQGTPKSNPPGFGSSPGNYPSHSEFASSQHLSVNKLGALSLGNLNKGSTKDSVFGQSCLAALSTACQNMIASLGAPNLNVTFNKKNQNEAKRKPGQVEQDMNSGSGGASGPGTEYFQSSASHNSQVPCSGNNNNNTTVGQKAKREARALSPNHNTDSGNEGKASVSRGRGKRRPDSGHVSPGNFSPPGSSNTVVSPGPQASALSVGAEGQGRTSEGSLLSPSFVKADLTTSMDSGIQSVGKSDGVSPCMDYLDDASPNYGGEDARVGRSSVKCGPDGRGGFPDTPCMEQARAPLAGSAQDEVHPLEILQAQIQLQRQQFSISEDQPLGGKPGRKPDCPSGLNGDCALAGCSPESGKGSVNTIDLDSLMAEQHATWYGSSNKALMEDPGNGQCVGFWDRARGQSDNKEGHG